MAAFTSNSLKLLLILHVHNIPSKFCQSTRQKACITMNDIVLKAEEEFSFIDAELDLKANILLQEVEKALREQKEQKHETDIEYGSVPNESKDLTTDDQNVSYEYDKGTTRQTPMRNVSSANEPELKFLRAKIKILTAEVERQRAEYRKKTGEWQEREKELMTIRQEQDKQIQQNSSLQQQLSKINATFKERMERIQTIESENAKLASDLQSAKRQAKTANQKASTLETRLNRLTEECESLKAASRTATLKHKEEGEEQRRVIEQQAICLKRSEKQRSELAMAFRRQMLLCHNMQQQKEYLIAGAALTEAELQFEQLLITKQKK